MFLNVVFVLFIIMSIVVLVMFFIAAGSVADGGHEIGLIRSVGGKTMEEAYYEELGKVYEGCAMALRAAGFFFSSVLLWMGFRAKR